MTIGNAWRTPVPTRNDSRWANDIRIGTRDSIYLNVLDVHRATGNLFAILCFEQGSNYYWSVNFSTNGGSDWSETYYWSAVYPIWIDASVLANHCYVAYSYGLYARIRRFTATTGSAENFNNGSAYITLFTTTTPDSLKEVALTSNQDQLDNRLYYLSLTTLGNLRYLWSDTAAVNWTEVLTGISNADRGLDATCNESGADYFLYSSYIDKSNTLRVRGRPATLMMNKEENGDPAARRQQ
jgi:hypothetical protein